MKHSPLRRRILQPAFWLAMVTTSLIATNPASRGEEVEFPPLTTVSGNPRLPGKFVWADLVTDNAAAARPFYAQLFHWRFQAVGNYLVAMSDSRPLAGIIQKPRPASNPNAKPRWFGYISVPDLKKAESVVTRGGGRTVASRTDFPGRGEQAVFADPEGAIFGVIKSSAGDPEDFLAEPGDWIWMQLLSRDPRKAGEFYQKVAKYDLVENTQPNRLNDYVLVSKGFARGTIRALPTERADVNPTWLPYVRVQNVSETAALARQLGGTILVEPRPELFQGKVGVIADPSGAAIGILEWAPELMKGGK
jgi:predicted enzyme related to lactoylglutathione lyase